MMRFGGSRTTGATQFQQNNLSMLWLFKGAELLSLASDTDGILRLIPAA